MDHKASYLVEEAVVDIPEQEVVVDILVEGVGVVAHLLALEVGVDHVRHLA